MFKAVVAILGFMTLFAVSIFYVYEHILEIMPVTAFQAKAMIVFAFGGIFYGCVYDTRAGLFAALAFVIFMGVATFSQSSNFFFAIGILLFVAAAFSLIVSKLVAIADKQGLEKGLSK